MKFSSKVLLISILSSTYLFSFQDLGIYGGLYDVKEVNMKKAIKAELVKKMPEIEKKAKEAFASGLIYKIDIPFSQKNETLTKEFALKLKDKNGIERTFKGDDSPYKIHDSLCIVNFQGYDLLDEVINSFGEKCRYVFLNVDIRKISKKKKYANLNKFIGNDRLFSMMPIKATPVKITLSNSSIVYKYLDYRKIRAKTKHRLLLENSDKE